MSYVADLAERIRARLHRRRDAYRAIFTPHGGTGPDAEVVLADLARYCHANRSSLKVSRVMQQVDPYATAFAEGQRDVFNRIMAQLNLTDDRIRTIAYSKENEQ